MCNYVFYVLYVVKYKGTYEKEKVAGRQPLLIRTLEKCINVTDYSY